VNSVTSIFGKDPTVLAIANMASLLSGAVLLGSFLWYLLRFARDVYRNSFSVALRMARYRWRRLIIHCAYDLHFFAAIIGTFFGMFALFCVLAVITVASMGAMIKLPLRPISVAERFLLGFPLSILIAEVCFPAFVIGSVSVGVARLRRTRRKRIIRYARLRNAGG
jgi:hypothetical protein